MTGHGQETVLEACKASRSARFRGDGVVQGLGGSIGLARSIDGDNRYTVPKRQY